jgi:membrane protease YdiL (CAAX protease family)
LVRATWQVYRRAAGDIQNPGAHFAIVWLSVSLIAGAVVPVVVARLAGRRPSEIGLAVPNRWGWRIAMVAVVVSLPFALAIASEQPPRADPMRTHAVRSRVWDLSLGLSTVPEHILITGICVASFLPGFRLPVPPPLAPSEGGRLRRVLRWLGLAQPPHPRAGFVSRALTWCGLDGRGLLAIAAAGALFGIVHMGKRPIEFTTSFPGGMAVCYVTYRSRSVLPGWIAHVGLMVFVQLFMLALRRG